MHTGMHLGVVLNGHMQFFPDGGMLGIYYDENSDSTVLSSDLIEDGHVYCLKEYVDFCDGSL